ncbi:serine/threonine protein kinase [Streptomyces pharetrae CZA14]|uniref:Serine/threonine protein kinase n=1 Tax=Streptomyces pharetrae CZA14 TaxID=1144883 RepID=A0ABX3Y656_9ACTN|nr:serine/threonine protein kinase [Streptomyces pharetrae CZA14]
MMTPPDLPPRPVPRAPLTDVVPRRTLIVIAVAVVVAVLGVVLALTLGGDEGSDQSRTGGDKAATGAGREPGTKNDPSGGVRTDGAATGSADATPDGTPSAPKTDGATGSAAASGGQDSGKDSGEDAGKGDGTAAVSTHQGAQGYSIGLPKGWKYQSSDAAGDRFTGPDGQKLLIGWTTTPKSDPVADWKNQERYMVRSQYDRIRIEKVGYRGWNTADWEFTYVDGGTKYRTVDRGFVVDEDQGYALMYTAKAAKWGSETRRITWQTLTKTFEPKA